MYRSAIVDSAAMTGALFAVRAVNLAVANQPCCRTSPATKAPLP
jgi:hypothetical protein